MARTKRSEMLGFVKSLLPGAGSELVGYNYNPTDGFLQTVLSQKFLEDEISQARSGRTLDGSSNMNDDFYRRTNVSSVNVTTSDGQELRRRELSLARQLASKKDQESVIRLVASSQKFKADPSKLDKKISPLINVVPPYTKFFLETVAEDRMEKAQVIETFGEFIAFFFGRRPEVYNFSGRLLNSKNHDWKNDFQEMYDFFLRGTKAVENNATVLIQYDDVIAEGFLMNCHMEYHGVTNNECPFSFAMLVTRRAPVNQLQRLRERRARSRFSAAEQQLLDDINRIDSQPIPFSIIKKALSSGGLSSSDIIVYTTTNNKVISSNKDNENVTNSENTSLDDVLGTPIDSFGA